MKQSSHIVSNKLLKSLIVKQSLTELVFTRSNYFKQVKQKYMKQFIAVILSIFILQSCSEHYGSGERVGLITKFSRSGLLFKSWEGELHVTQTGMNSTMNEFDFSIDNNDESDKANMISVLDSASKQGWKVRLIYHEVRGKNITRSRGETNFFVDSVQVEDRNMASLFSNNKNTYQGHVIDTIYVVIDKSK